MAENSVPSLRAILWDVDGTLAETERDGHRVAFNLAFSTLDIPWRWSEARYGELLAVAGGLERILHDMDTQVAAPADRSARVRLATRLHRLKNQCYVRLIGAQAVGLREGVRELMSDCEAAGVHMGIVTTSGLGNVAALLHPNLGGSWRSRFSVVVCAEEVARKKPDPQAYQRALEQLGLRAAEVVAIEDSPVGVTAARSACIAVLVTRSFYFASADVSGAMAVGPSLVHSAGWHPRPEVTGRIDLRQICQWHRASVLGAKHGAGGG